MLNKRPEQTCIRVGQLPVGVIHQAALGSRGIVGDIRAAAALAALCAVDVQFGDVNRQTERLHFRQRLVFSLKARRRNIDVGL